MHCMDGFRSVASRLHSLKASAADGCALCVSLCVCVHHWPLSNTVIVFIASPDRHTDTQRVNGATDGQWHHLADSLLSVREHMSPDHRRQTTDRKDRGAAVDQRGKSAVKAQREVLPGKSFCNNLDVWDTYWGLVSAVASTWHVKQKSNPTVFHFYSSRQTDLSTLLPSQVWDSRLMLIQIVKTKPEVWLWFVILMDSYNNSWFPSWIKNNLNCIKL